MKPRPASEVFSRYVQNYDEHTSGRGLAGRTMAKGHRLLESTQDGNCRHRSILEVGSGTGQHIRYVSEGYESYCISDSDKEMLDLAKKNLPARLESKVTFDLQDAASTTYEDESFDRLIASHVLEHIPDPVQALIEWNRIVKTGGVISIMLPCDPGLLWRFGRHLGPRKKAEEAGIPYDYNQAVEHVNSIFNLVAFIRYHFESVEEYWHPARIPVPDLNLFYICHIRK